MKSFKIAKVDSEFKSDIISIDFNHDGTKVLCCDDISLRVYNCKTGKRIKMLYNKTNKISLCRFTHNDNAVIIATKNKPF
jgi:COMPASS component SWD2